MTDERHYSRYFVVTYAVSKIIEIDMDYQSATLTLEALEGGTEEIKMTISQFFEARPRIGMYYATSSHFRDQVLTESQIKSLGKEITLDEATSILA